MDDDASIRALHERNRIAWNEAAVDYDRRAGDLDLYSRGQTTLKPVELEHLGDLSWCGRAIHLQCASGADTLSLHQLGAREVVGVDISDVHIANAQHKTEALGLPARWYRTDLLDTPHELDGTADLVYTGKGAICWLQDIEAWACVVYRLLRPGGRFYMFDQHPIGWLFKEDATAYEREPEWSYFRTAPMVSRGWGEEYVGNLGKDPSEMAEKYDRLWAPSVVINHLVAAGLVLDRFHELPDWPYSFPNFKHIPSPELEALPQSYAVLAHRPG